MVRGGGKGSDALEGSLVAGKPYKDAIKDLIRNTAVHAGDLDARAVDLLDALESRGKAKEACIYLKRTIATFSRDRISNWKAYIYKLLRGFDQEAYDLMKTEKGADKRRSKVEKRSEFREERKARDSASSAADVESMPAAESDSKAEAEGKLATFNQAAVEFVPGKTTWTGTGGEATKGFSVSAADFVPGRPWAGTEAEKPTSTFAASAPEFVPGQLVWGDAAAARAREAYSAQMRTAASRVGDGQARVAAARAEAYRGAMMAGAYYNYAAALQQQAAATSAFQANATPFVPGGARWPPQSPQAKARSVAVGMLGAGAAGAGGEQSSKRQRAGAKAVATPKASAAQGAVVAALRQEPTNGSGRGNSSVEPPLAAQATPAAEAPKGADLPPKVTAAAVAEAAGLTPSENTDGSTLSAGIREIPLLYVGLALAVASTVVGFVYFRRVRR